ncbi:MAG TPA: phosphoenolpyruvate carboxykinase (ATP) [Thermomicrobiales bacterium]|nr:phosphoenolpyruvate carboxykinase (ATP) [Thermomicrobiales bacterium]
MHVKEAPVGAAHRNPGRVELIERAIQREEGALTASGALAVTTGEHTGRSPEDKFIVEEPATRDDVWWGPVNKSYPEQAFERLYARFTEHLAGQETFGADLWTGADPMYRLRVRVVSETAWCTLFARNLFIEPDGEAGGPPDFTVLHAPTLRLDPDAFETRSETAIVVHLSRGLVLIAGTGYAGEIKKSIFSVMQYLLPKQGVATMHCSANAGPGGDTAIFFGLSGTGKTTLSTDATRTLIGDDEHGWTDQGIFNFEGGSYAKVIDLSAEAEPEIWAASHQFGTILENVVLDPRTRRVDFGDTSLTENTRAAFPLSAIPGASETGRGAHPSNVIMLTADAFGVLPPVARLTTEQAIYYYLSGYTSKLAGTEMGVDEPEATFSACFGGPFLPLHPTRYAELLAERIRRHGSNVWLVNTGWTGGPYGIGHRISIDHTRAIVRAIIGGSLDAEPVETDPVFGLAIPASCPGVPPSILRPRSSWEDVEAYDRRAARLAASFARNFAQYREAVGSEIASAGPGKAD